MTVADRVKVPGAFWLGVDRLNIRRSELLRQASLPVQLGQDNARLSTSQFFALWRGLEVLIGPDVGLRLAQFIDTATMPPSLMVAYHSKNLGDALARVARFKMLCAPEVLNIRNEGENCAVSFVWPHGGDAPVSLTDATLASLISLARDGTGLDIRPARIDLQRNSDAATKAHFSCPIRWNAVENRLVFRKSDLNLSFVRYNQEFILLLDKALSAEADASETDATVAERVRWLIRRNLTAGRPDLPSIARELAVSGRSLQRQLNACGQSFQSLLEQTRRSLARDYLAENELDVGEIAYMLGYNDQGSFYRSFQRWEGSTPTEFRKRARTTDQSFQPGA